MRLMTREGLCSLKKRAIRQRVWFGVLTKIERGIVDLTVKCVDRIRSDMLSLVIGRIVCKIANALKSRFLERVDAVGYNLVERISKIAVGWGYVEAMGWKRDLNLVRHLGVNAVNNGSGWAQV